MRSGKGKDKRTKETFSLDRTHPRTDKKYSTHEPYELSKCETGQLPLGMSVSYLVIQKIRDYLYLSPYPEYMHT